MKTAEYIKDLSRKLAKGLFSWDIAQLRLKKKGLSDKRINEIKNEIWGIK